MYCVVILIAFSGSYVILVNSYIVLLFGKMFFLFEFLLLEIATSLTKYALDSAK